MNKILPRIFEVNKTIKSYRRVIWFYDLWSRFTESKAISKVMEIANLRNNQNVLEIACGTGILFEQILLKNPTGYNVGIDISPDMLQKTGSKNYELHEGNALNLNLNSNSYDILINNFMIDLMPEESFDIIANEFYRVLNRNGTAIISTFSFGTKSVNKCWFWVAKYLPGLLTGCRPVLINEHLEKAGFVIKEVYQISQNTFPSEVIKAQKLSVLY